MIFKGLRLITLFLIPFYLSFEAQGQTITTSAPTQTSGCAGGTIIIEYETEGQFNFNATFTAQLSNASGSFDNPVDIGSIPVNAGTIVGTIPFNTTFGINYRVRVISSNPAVIGSVSPDPPIVITNSAITATIVAYPPTPVCEGQTVTLTANYNQGYFWSTGQTTQSITVAQGGTYSVTVTNFITNCQVAANPVDVVVNPLPVVDLGNDTVLCTGDTLILKADSTYSIYNWNNGDSYAQQYAVTSTGTYHVRVVDANGCSKRDTVFVQFMDKPVICLGNDTTICGNGFLLEPGYGYHQYNWNNGLSSMPNLWIHQSGTYTVEVKDTNNCATRDTVIIQLFNKPILNLGNSINVCGNSVMLNAGGGFSSYNWNNGDSYSQYYTAYQSGLYHVNVTDTNNCSVSDSIAVNINPIPVFSIGNDTTIHINSTLVLNAGNNFSSYFWNTGDTTQAILIIAANHGLGSHFFEVYVTDSNNCSSSNHIIVNISEDAGLSAIDKHKNINIYPLPFSGTFYIEGFGSFNNLELYAIDLLGRRTRLSHTTDNNIITVFGNNLNKGVYLLQMVKDNKTVYKQKIVVY